MVTVLVAVVSEIFVSSVQKAGETLRLSPAFVGFIVVALVGAASIVGLLIEAAVPQLLPENGLTTSIGAAAQAGVFAIWAYLIWRIFGTIQGIYGPENQCAERIPAARGHWLR